MKTNWMENLVIYDSETFTGGLIWIQESVESWLLHESHNIFFLHSSPFAIFEGFDWMRKSSDGRCTQVDSRTIYVHSFSINAYMAGPCIFYFKHDAVIVADLYDFDHLRALWIPPLPTHLAGNRSRRPLPPDGN